MSDEPGRLSPEAARHALGHWLAAHGLTEVEGRLRGVVVAPEPSPWPAVLVLDVGGAVIVRAPAEHQASLASALCLAQPWGDDVVAWCRSTLGDLVVGASGPDLLSFADPPCFRPAPLPPGVSFRRTGGGDEQLLPLALAVGSREWDSVGLGHALAGSVAVLESPEGGVVAAAGWSVVGGLAHLGVVVHPEARGRGLGAGATSASAIRALEDGLVLQWRAAERDVAAIGLGRRLGFEALARRWVLALALPDEGGR